MKNFWSPFNLSPNIYQSWKLATNLNLAFMSLLKVLNDKFSRSVMVFGPSLKDLSRIPIWNLSLSFCCSSCWILCSGGTVSLAAYLSLLLTALYPWINLLTKLAISPFSICPSPFSSNFLKKLLNWSTVTVGFPLSCMNSFKKLSVSSLSKAPLLSVSYLPQIESMSAYV